MRKQLARAWVAQAWGGTRTGWDHRAKQAQRESSRAACRVKTRVLGRDGRGPPASAGAEVAQEAAASNGVLLAVFTEVCAGSGNAGR